MNSSSGISDQLDYAIVGGGVSGLYTAWRVLTGRRTKEAIRVGVFESSDRVGGRLLTWNPFGADAGLRAELGGMRFLNEQKLVWNLVGHLGCKTTDFHVKSAGLRWYLRGSSMKSGNVVRALAKYGVREGEELAPDDLLKRVINTVLEDRENRQVLDQVCGVGNRPATRKQWDEVKPRLHFRGKRLDSLGFWNVMSDILSPEAYQFVVDTLGYYTLAQNWNAAEAIQSFSLEFATERQYYTIASGYETLPQKLADKVKEAAGEINLKHQVLSFEKNAGGYNLRIMTENGEKTVHASTVVLALPRRSLELLTPTSTFNPKANKDLRKLITSVRSRPAFKLFLFYKQRWWDSELPEWYQDGSVLRGRSVSDLPIRQTYYMPPDKGKKGKYGLIMASYNDGQAVGFWQGLESGETAHADDEALMEAVTNFIVETDMAEELKVKPKPPPVLHKATDGMIRHARQQLALLHGKSVDEIPPPMFGAYADWDADPFGGGWSDWEPQANVKDVMTRIKQPLGDSENVFVVGESYSGIQAWVEGALTTAEKVVQDKFKLDPPEGWWPENYYLGW